MMKIAIHQPQYLPWPPYFVKMEKSDAFIFLDGVAYQKNGIQNRNTVKTPQGATWLTVPVSASLGTPIKDVCIANQAWRKKHWLTIEQNYKKAPYFEQFADVLKSIYDREWSRLSDLNIHLSRMIMGWLGVVRPTFLQSELGAAGGSTDLLVKICEKVGASSYLSGPGGSNYMDVGHFQSAGVEVEILPPMPPSPYPQQHKGVPFIGNLSVLDILLNCGTDWIDHMPTIDSRPWQPDAAGKSR